MGQTKYNDELRERSTSVAVEALANPARTEEMVRRIG